jgi:acid phosphatase
MKNRKMRIFLGLAILLVLAVLAIGLARFAGNSQPAQPSASASWPANLPVYDHIVIVMEENKDYNLVLDPSSAPYITNTLKAEGANFMNMFGEEHFSQGNYFWLFSGDDQNVGFIDQIPASKIYTNNLGQQLILKNLSFKGYSEDLPAIGSEIVTTSPCPSACYARKHVPWVSFGNVPNGTTVPTSSNLRFQDFPSDYSQLPTVAFVIPNLLNDMHNGNPPESVTAGDTWLKQNLDSYYQWAKTHNSLLILTFDEDSDDDSIIGLTNPGSADAAQQNRIVTIFAGAHIQRGTYLEGKGITHVNILRTLEAMYGLQKSGAQQRNALNAGITDSYIITDIFTPLE